MRTGCNAFANGKRELFLALIAFVVILLANQFALAQARLAKSFDADWRFYKGDADGANIPAFDDSAWRKLSVPHDWSIEGPFDPKNPTGPAGGFLPAGVGWYRKHFTVSKDQSNRRIFIDFDGVMANSDVWINDFYLGKRPY